MSTVTVTGNLTDNPELRFTPSGIAVANFSVAENHRRMVDGEWQDAGTTFHRVTVWREYAENVADSLVKGMHVMVYGDIHDEPWQDKEGNTRHNLVIAAYEVAPTLRFGTAKVTKVNREPAEEPEAPKPARTSRSRTTASRR